MGSKRLLRNIRDLTYFMKLEKVEESGRTIEFEVET